MRASAPNILALSQQSIPRKVQRGHVLGSWMNAPYLGSRKVEECHRENEQRAFEMGNQIPKERQETLLPLLQEPLVPLRLARTVFVLFLLLGEPIVLRPDVGLE